MALRKKPQSTPPVANGSVAVSAASIICGTCAALILSIRGWLVRTVGEPYIWLNVVAMLLAIAGIVLGIKAFKQRRIFLGLVLAIMALMICSIPWINELFLLI